MILIAHRGNITGPQRSRENTPGYIDIALALGYDVELDIRGADGRLWMGHDIHESIPVSTEFLKEREAHLWVHCKNAMAIQMILELTPGVRFFFHHADDYTLTSDGFVWCYPGKTPPTPRSIAVLPETVMRRESIPGYLLTERVVGVCSDYVGELSEFQNA